MSKLSIASEPDDDDVTLAPLAASDDDDRMSDVTVVAVRICIRSLPYALSHAYRMATVATRRRKSWRQQMRMVSQLCGM